VSPLIDGLPSSEVPTLREYEQRWRDHLEVHKAEERERANAVTTINERLAGMNEFRGQISDLISTLLSKVEFNAWREGMETRLRWVVTTLLAGGAVVLAVLGLMATKT
jgi:hypothetical protein